MTNVVELRDVSRHYETKGGVVRALDGVSLKIGVAEFAAVAGPSGSGKSTLLNIIGALDRPTHGDVLVEGRSLQSCTEKELSALRRDRIGFVFQSYNLIPVMTVLENTEYVMMIAGMAEKVRRERAVHVLERLGLDGLENRRPPELSGGQQQRVAVARAIAPKPAIVLADEPTANLDSVTGESLMDLMAELNREEQTTFLFSSHDPMVMERARRRIRLKDGKITSDERTDAPAGV